MNSYQVHFLMWEIFESFSSIFCPRLSTKTLFSKTGNAVPDLFLKNSSPDSQDYLLI